MMITVGMIGYGAVIGWYVYYINRYRKGDVQLSDITTLVAAIGGGAAATLLPDSDAGGPIKAYLFAAYGLGLFLGFFGYFISLLFLVSLSGNFTSDWFLDGRRKAAIPPFFIPDYVSSTFRPAEIAVEPEPKPQVQIVGGGTVHVYGTATAAPENQKVAAQPAPGFAGIAPAPAAVLPKLDQQTVDTCANVVLEDGSSVNGLFAGSFIDWYNTNLSGTDAFRHRGRISTSGAVATRFAAFWDMIPAVFGKDRITAIEFAALMCIGIQENGGDLSANPELVGNAAHPGLSYAFDRIPGLKNSYNKVNGNLSAFSLFQSPDYLAAHRALPGAAQAVDSGVSPAWDGETWPSGFRTDVDATINGFIMQADFYKLRGRGVIQTTGRDGYREMVDFMLGDPASHANATLSAIVQRWRTGSQAPAGTALLDYCITVSTAQDWDAAFGEAPILAAAVRRDSDGKGHYLDLSHAAPVLGGNASTPGSLYYMARKINGGSYPDTVVAMMDAMLIAIPSLAGGLARQPRAAA